MRREACPVCGARSAAQLDYIDRVPVLLNRLCASVDEAQATPQGILDIVGCNRCGFVWNRSFDPERLSYDPTYENDQSFSAAFRAHADSMASKVLNALAANDVTSIVEVGCGQGAFLRALVANAGPKLERAVGFDPAFRDGTPLDPRIHVFREYFGNDSSRLLDTPPSLVITRHAIEHVSDPVGFLKSIRSGIGTTAARLFVETPDVTWIVDRGESEDLFYEHCSLFDPHALALALKEADFTPLKIECVFDGQYLWAEAVANQAGQTEMVVHHRQTAFPSLTVARHAFVTEWRQIVAQFEPVVVWGAGAKGVTFCTLVDPTNAHIAAVVDINPAKQGKFIPLTGHRVIGPDQLAGVRPKLAVVMNPNYRAEIAANLAEMGLGTRLMALGE